MTAPLTEALIRLANFRRGWEDTDVIDEDSGLTAADLDLVIAMGAAHALDIRGKPIEQD